VPDPLHSHTVDTNQAHRRTNGRSGTYELSRLTDYVPSVLSEYGGGPIAQRQSTSFARRKPWVQIPVGPSLGVHTTSVPLSGNSHKSESRRRTDAPSRESEDGKGSTHAPERTLGTYDDNRVYVHSRHPLDPFIGQWSVPTESTHYELTLESTIWLIHRISRMATVPAGG
jgi:hypothetical protein